MAIQMGWGYPYHDTHGRGTDNISLSPELRGTESTSVQIGGISQYTLEAYNNIVLQYSFGKLGGNFPARKINSPTPPPQIPRRHPPGTHPISWQTPLLEKTLTPPPPGTSDPPPLLAPRTPPSPRPTRKNVRNVHQESSSPPELSRIFCSYSSELNPPPSSLPPRAHLRIDILEKELQTHHRICTARFE